MRNDNERSPKIARKIDRRRLLTGASLAIGAAGAAAATGSNPAVAASEPKTPQSGGYRETEAVKTYYRLARF